MARSRRPPDLAGRAESFPALAIQSRPHPLAPQILLIHLVLRRLPLLALKCQDDWICKSSALNIPKRQFGISISKS